MRNDPFIIGHYNIAELGVLALKSGSKGQEGEGEAVEMGLEIIFWTTETAQH